MYTMGEGRKDMGLFSSNKKTCPICGGATPKLFATKIGGLPLCKECANKAHLPEEIFLHMTMDDFRQYLDLYEANQPLRDMFTETNRFSFGIFGGSVLVDTKHKLLRLKDDKYAWVFEASQLLSFCVLEDGMPLFEGSKTSFKSYPSEVPGRLNDLASQITKMMMNQRALEVLDKVHDKVTEGDNKSNHNSEPYIEFPTPFQYFQMEFQLDHPYWTTFMKQEEGPILNRQRPNIEEYRRTYTERVEEFRIFANCLMQLLNTNTKEMQGSGVASVQAQQTASADDVAKEIQKYKALFDAGMITEEEFTAKKRQILGI